MNIIEANLKWNGLLTLNNDPKYIVLHHAESSKCTIQDVHSWHLSNGWIGCGYHYFVRKDGTIYRGRPERAQGSHCPGANNKSIGICAEGAYMNEAMPQAQFNAIVELGTYLKNKYNIKEVYGHKELHSTDCPGKNYPLLQIKTSILNNIMQRKVDNMSILDLQKFCNKIGATDYEGKALVEDGFDGKRTQAAKAKAKAILNYILA